MSGVPGLSNFLGYLQTVDLNQLRGQVISWIATAAPTTPGQPSVPATPHAAAGQPSVPAAFNDETISKIEKFAPAAFAVFTVLYCLFKHTPAFLAGLSLAIYQKNHPGHLTNTLESFAKTNLPYRQISILLDSHIATISIAALAAMWAPNTAQSCVPIYFTYVATTELLTPVEEQKK